MHSFNNVPTMCTIQYLRQQSHETVNWQIINAQIASQQGIRMQKTLIYSESLDKNESAQNNFDSSHLLKIDLFAPKKKICYS